MLLLSAKWAPLLTSQPEAGMGWQVATIRLKDGRSFEHVVIQAGTVASIANDPHIPFFEDDIAQIVVTNDISWRH